MHHYSYCKEYFNVYLHYCCCFCTTVVIVCFILIVFICSCYLWIFTLISWHLRSVKTIKFYSILFITHLFASINVTFFPNNSVQFYPHTIEICGVKQHKYIVSDPGYTNCPFSSTCFNYLPHFRSRGDAVHVTVRLLTYYESDPER